MNKLVALLCLIGMFATAQTTTRRWVDTYVFSGTGSSQTAPMRFWDTKWRVVYKAVGAPPFELYLLNLNTHEQLKVTNQKGGKLKNGQTAGSGSMAGTLFSGLGSLAGLDTSFFGGRSFDVEAAAQYLADNQFDASSLYWQKNKDGNLVISLPEDQWDLIQEVQKGLFYDEGTGYIELGRDDTYFYDDEDNLLPDTEKTWLHIGGQPVAYFSLGSTEKENGSYIYTGRVPANLNGQRVNLILSFDEDEAEWNILGAQTDYAADETDTVARGLTELKAGDKLDFLADFYSYEGDVQDSYLIGNTLEVTDDMTVMDAYLDDQNTLILYRFTDMYQQHYWTEVLPQ